MTETHISRPLASTFQNLVNQTPEHGGIRRLKIEVADDLEPRGSVLSARAPVTAATSDTSSDQLVQGQREAQVGSSEDVASQSHEESSAARIAEGGGHSSSSHIPPCSTSVSADNEGILPQTDLTAPKDVENNRVKVEDAQDNPENRSSPADGDVPNGKTHAERATTAGTTAPMTPNALSVHSDGLPCDPELPILNKDGRLPQTSGAQGNARFASGSVASSVEHGRKRSSDGINTKVNGYGEKRRKISNAGGLNEHEISALVSEKVAQGNAPPNHEPHPRAGGTHQHFLHGDEKGSDGEAAPERRTESSTSPPVPEATSKPAQTPGAPHLVMANPRRRYDQFEGRPCGLSTNC